MLGSFKKVVVVTSTNTKLLKFNTERFIESITNEFHENVKFYSK